MSDELSVENIASKKISILNAIAAAVNTMNNQILQIFTADDSDEDDEPIIRLLSDQVNGPNEHFVSNTKKRMRIKKFAEKVVPRFKGKEFEHHFRMTKINFEILLTKLAPLITNQDTGRPFIQAQKQLMIVVSVLVSTENFSLIADKFEITKATVEDCFQRTILALQQLAATEIVWPTGGKVEKIVSSFNKEFGFPGVLGVIGTIHIPIRPPHNNPDAYINHKKRYSMILQAVCDNNLNFISCFSEYPGSIHSFKVFEYSNLKSEIESDPSLMVPNDFQIIGNSLFLLKPWLMVPFHDNEQFSQSMINYNSALFKTHGTIKKAFALLKGRLRRLTLLNMNKTDLISVCIMACCVLHNIVLQNDDNIREYIEEGMTYPDDYDDDDLNDLCREEPDNDAVKKRESLVKYFK